MQQSRYSVSRAGRSTDTVPKGSREGGHSGTHDPLYIRMDSEGKSLTATFPFTLGHNYSAVRGLFTSLSDSWVSLDHRVLSRQIMEYAV